MVSRNSILIGFAVYFVFSASAAVAQFQFTLPSGEIIDGETDTTFFVEDPLSKSIKVTFTPKEGYQTAHLIMRKNGEVTHFYAKKIFYSDETQELLLEENAHIKKADNYMTGPVKIQFFPEKNVLMAYGNSKQPAVVNYMTEDKRKLYSVSEAFQFTFVMKDGKRELKEFHPMDNMHESSTITIKKSGAAPKEVKRKISPPK